MTWTICQGDVREQLAKLPEKSCQVCVTSPPYWSLRDYGCEGQLGLEETPQLYVEHMVEVFRGVWRVLRDDGVLFLNMGDSYSNQGKSGGNGGCKNYTSVEGGYQRTKHDTGLKPKDLCGIPWRLAFALQADGWYLRSDIIWAKRNCMPGSQRDRPTTAHEYLFLLTKKPRYYYDGVAIAEPSSLENAAWGSQTRVKRSVWWLASHPYKAAHFATFPPKLVEPCILAGTSEKGCCPECGKPWVRMTEKRRVPTRPAHESKVFVDPEVSPYERHNGTIVGNRDPERHVTEVVTTGWEPGCKCEAGEPVPCTVLDPFAGAGTTLMVAERLGRNSVGIELKPEYVTMANERILADIEKRRAKVRKEESLPLFEGM